MFQGFWWQCYRICCLFLAFYLAILFSNGVNALLSGMFNIENAMYTGWASLFFGTLLITFVAGMLVSRMLAGRAGGGGLISGALLGTVKNCIFCSLIITSLWIMGTENERRPINNSAIGTQLRTATLFTIYKLPQSLRP